MVDTVESYNDIVKRQSDSIKEWGDKRRKSYYDDLFIDAKIKEKSKEDNIQWCIDHRIEILPDIEVWNLDNYGQKPKYFYQRDKIYREKRQWYIDHEMRPPPVHVVKSKKDKEYYDLKAIRIEAHKKGDTETFNLITKRMHEFIERYPIYKAGCWGAYFFDIDYYH